MWNRVVLEIAKISLLIIGSIAVIEGSLSEAIFSKKARVLGPDGNELWLNERTLMMHAGEYHIAAGKKFLEYAETRFGVPRREGFEQAAAHFKTAITHRPQDPYAWTYLALAAQNAGNYALARGALVASHAHAPYLTRLGALRVRIAAQRWARLTAEEFNIIEAELRHMRQYDFILYRKLLRRHSRLAGFAKRRLGQLPF